MCLRKLYPFEIVTSEVGIDHFAKLLRSQMHFCHIVIQAKEELFRRVIFVKVLYIEMILARIHSTKKKIVLIFFVLYELGFFVSLGAKYPCDLRSMIQFWILPKKRTLSLKRVRQRLNGNLSVPA